MGKTHPRKVAVEAGNKRYFTGKPCPRGHITERIVSSRECVGCVAAKNAAQSAHPDGRRRRACEKWRAKQPKGYKNTPANVIRCARWYQKNKEVARNRCSIYRKRARRAMIKLSDEAKREMRLMYAQARALSVISGIPYEVDHIIPLRGELVSGLHVPWNMQVIPKSQNASKYNLVDLERYG